VTSAAVGLASQTAFTNLTDARTLVAGILQRARLVVAIALELARLLRLLTSIGGASGERQRCDEKNLGVHD
jgi:hypothetical protein